MNEKRNNTIEYTHIPIRPREWSLFRKITIATCIVLFIDWILAWYIPLNSIRYSYIGDIFPDSLALIAPLPFIMIVFIIICSIFQTNELLDTPFYSAVMIKVILNLGVTQFTLLGWIGVEILDIICTIVIVVVFVFNIICEVSQPINYAEMMLIGIFLLGINYFVNSLIYVGRFNEIWGGIYLLIVIIGFILINKKHVFIGAFLLLSIGIINNYIVSFELTGFETGAEIVLFIGLFLVIHPIHYTDY